METHENEELPLLKALAELQRLTLGSFDRRQFNCTKTQLTIFAALSRRGSLTMRQVAEYISSSSEQATRAVAPLVDMGYVERFIIPENRTRVHVRLTQEGTEYARRQSVAICRQIAGRLSDEDRLRLNQAAQTIITMAEKV